jgi:hypothetical protein
MHPSGSVGLRDGSAVDGGYQKVADRIRGSESEKQRTPAVFEGPNHEDCTNEKQTSLQTERGVHQVSQRGVDRVTLKHAARGDPEITDEVVRVAVMVPKARGRNGFENYVPESCGNPHSGCTRGE